MIKIGLVKELNLVIFCRIGFGDVEVVCVGRVCVLLMGYVWSCWNFYFGSFDEDGYFEYFVVDCGG